MPSVKNCLARSRQNTPQVTVRRFAPHFLPVIRVGRVNLRTVGAAFSGQDHRYENLVLALKQHQPEADMPMLKAIARKKGES